MARSKFMHIMVGQDGIERNGTEDGAADVNVGGIGIINGKEIFNVLVIQAAFIDVVASVHDEIGMGLVGVKCDGALAR